MSQIDKPKELAPFEWVKQPLLKQVLNKRVLIVRNPEMLATLNRQGGLEQAGFSSDGVKVIKKVLSLVGKNLPDLLILAENTDENDLHTRLRAEVESYFRKESFDSKYTPIFEDLVKSEIQKIENNNEIDFTDLANIIPAHMISIMLGLASQTEDFLARIIPIIEGEDVKLSITEIVKTIKIIIKLVKSSYKTIKALYDEDALESINTIKELQEKGLDVDDTIISHLMSLNKTNGEIFGHVLMYAGAGVATTSIAQQRMVLEVLQSFQENGNFGELEILAGDATEEEKFKFIESYLKGNPIVEKILRKNTKPVTLNIDGQTLKIPKNTNIIFDVKDLNDSGKKSYSFGMDRHYCIGAQLALRIIAISMKEILRMIREKNLVLKTSPTIGYSDKLNTQSIESHMIIGKAAATEA